MTRFLWRSGTASCPLTPATAPRYRGSLATSLTSIGRCSATAAPTYALADLQPEVPDDVVRVAFRIGDVQLLVLVVEEVDREDREGRQPGDQPRDAPQQLVQVENGRDFAPELEQGGDELLMLVIELLFRQRWTQNVRLVMIAGSIAPAGPPGGTGAEC